MTADLAAAVTPAVQIGKEDRDGMVPVTYSGSPADIAAQLRTLSILLRNADLIERGKHGEGYHHNQTAGTVAVRGTIDPDMATMQPVEGLPVVLLSWIPESRIDPRHREFARRHVNRAAAQLGLDGPRLPIRWFGPAVGDGDFWAPAYLDGYALSGLTPDDEIGGVAFARGLRGDAFVGIIAHEVRHVAQAVLRAQLEDRTWCERDADDFAAAYLARTDS